MLHPQIAENGVKEEPEGQGGFVGKMLSSQARLTENLNLHDTLGSSDRWARGLVQEFVLKKVLACRESGESSFDLQTCIFDRAERRPSFSLPVVLKGEIY